MDYATLAAKLGGVPVQEQRGQDSMDDLSLKDQHEIRKKENAEGRKRIADLSMDISKARGIMDSLNEFGRLNRESSTGSWWQQLTPDKQMFRNPQSMEMAAIQSDLGPNRRVEGSGASSDRDVSLFLKGLPSTENKGPVNRGIREDFERKYKYGTDKLTAMQSYFDEKGTLNGFDTEWSNRKQKSDQTEPTAAEISLVKSMRANGATDAQIAAELTKNERRKNPASTGKAVSPIIWEDDNYKYRRLPSGEIQRKRK